MGNEKHSCGTERLSSGIEQQGDGIELQRLSDDQLGRRMAMKRHSLATMSKAWGEEKNGKEQRWHREAVNGKGIA